MRWIYLLLLILFAVSVTAPSGVFCWNGTNFSKIYEGGVSYPFYEEGIQWNYNRTYDSQYITESIIEIQDNESFTGNVTVQYDTASSENIGNAVPLGSIFSSTGVVFVIVMASLLFIIIKFLKNKNS